MNTTAGIYLVGWYPLEQWNTTTADDYRKSKAKQLGSSSELQTRLAQQAGTIQGAAARRTYPYVLTIPRATPVQ